MSGNRRKYTSGYREQAVRLVVDTGRPVAHVAAEIGVGEQLIGRWASHVGPPSVDTVIGHSYGSTLVAAAASDGHHLAADNVIAVGSPGMLVPHASDLSLDSVSPCYSGELASDDVPVPAVLSAK